MFKMEISLNSNKIIQEGLNPAYINEQIDDLMQSLDIKKAGDGVFVGTGSPHDFAHFGVAITSLGEEEWLLPYMDKWLWFNSKGSPREDDYVIEDVADYYRKIQS